MPPFVPRLDLSLFNFFCVTGSNPTGIKPLEVFVAKCWEAAVEAGFVLLIAAVNQLKHLRP